MRRNEETERSSVTVSSFLWRQREPRIFHFYQDIDGKHLMAIYGGPRWMCLRIRRGRWHVCYFQKLRREEDSLHWFIRSQEPSKVAGILLSSDLLSQPTKISRKYFWQRLSNGFLVHKGRRHRLWKVIHKGRQSVLWSTLRPRKRF